MAIERMSLYMGEGGGADGAHGILIELSTSEMVIGRTDVFLFRFFFAGGGGGAGRCSRVFLILGGHA